MDAFRKSQSMFLVLAIKCVTATIMAYSVFLYAGIFCHLYLDSIDHQLKILFLATLLVLCCTWFNQYQRFGPLLFAWWPGWNSGVRSRFWGMPEWFPFCALLLFIVLIGHMLWFICAPAGYPSILNGIYVLVLNGKVVRAITESAYLCLRSDELRIWALFIIFFNFFNVTYWWLGSGSNRIRNSLILPDTLEGRE